MSQRRFPLISLLLTAVLVAACSSSNNNNNANTAAQVTVVPPHVTVAAATTPAPASATRAATSAPATAAPTAPATSAPTAARTASPAPAAAPVTGSLIVFAGSSLTAVFNQVGGDLMKANPGLTIKFNFGSSAALRTQMAQAAPADVFASADQPNMDGARQDGSIDGADQPFAKNKLIVIFPKGSTKVATIQDLAKPGINFVLADASVPVGNFARMVLQKLAADPAYGAGFDQKVLANLKSNETDDAATVATVQTGQADAAIVYSTDVSAAAAAQLGSITIPDNLNIVTTYPIALVKNAPNKAAGQAFITYLRSAAGQNTLKQAGFIVDATTGAAAGVVSTHGPVLLSYQQTGGFSPTFTVTGAVSAPATYALADLQALPAETEAVHYLSGTSPTDKMYTGVRLYDLLMAAQPQQDPAIKNDILRDSILVTGSDGYQTVIAWGEIDPGFENKDVLVAYADAGGQPLRADEGMARVLVPGDLKAGRYVSNVVSITLLKPAQ